MQNIKPTGRQRYRVHKTCFGPPLLVLQLQFEGPRAEWCYGWVETKHSTWWEDARPEHLLTFTKGEQD